MAGYALSTKEASQMLGCSIAWVCQLIRRGDIDAKRFGQRNWMIDKDALDRYLAKREQEVKRRE
jgi:excisionase family DNA binding protein